MLLLHAQGHSVRSIARSLGVSRGAVRDIIISGSEQVPRLQREARAEAQRARILELFPLCKGNLVRVHEELVKGGATYSYQALTAFCRRAGIGHEPRRPVGQYHFEPGEEMQHDTSPHEAELAGQKTPVQTASLVLAHSRMLYFQCYPRFTRFECKVFLTEAFKYLGGTAKTCLIDNTHVVVRRGTGSEMEPVEEMAAFSERYGFVFQAHAVGDPDRKARVERRFSFIENNFLAHRPATDWADLNRQAVAWCDRVNSTFRSELRASARELFAAEKARLTPLPIWVPEVYQVQARIVDVEGYISLHAHRYSVPWPLIGRQLEVRESYDAVTVLDGPRVVATHLRVSGQVPTRITEPAHRPPRGTSRPKEPPEQEELSRVAPALAQYLVALREKHPGRAVPAARRLLRIARDYPREPLERAVQTALEHRLFDLERLERMVLRHIGDDFFPDPHRKDSP